MGAPCAVQGALVLDQKRAGDELERVALDALGRRGQGSVDGASPLVSAEGRGVRHGRSRRSILGSAGLLRLSGIPLISNGFPLHPLRELGHRRELVRRLGPRPQSVRRRLRLGEQFRGATSEPLPLRQDIPGQLQRLRVPSEPRVEDAPAGLACPARDDQLLPGPGAGHIEDALLLGFQKSGFLALVLEPVQRLGEGTRTVRPGGDGHGCEGFRFAPRSASRMRIRTARSRNALPGVGQDHDGRLQPLRLVQVHDPHGVIVPRVERGFGIFPVQRRFQGVYGSGQRSISPQRLRSHGVQRVGQNAGPQRSQLASGHVGA